MKTTLQCLPCFVRQIIEAASLGTDNDEIKMKAIKEGLKIIPDFQSYLNPPHMAAKIYTTVNKICNNFDPYRQLKDKSTEMALSLLPELEKTVNAANYPFGLAAKLAAAGNIIDFGVLSSSTEIDIDAVIQHAIDEDPAIDHIKELEGEVNSASSILYLTDNAGEIVFDRLLLSRLPLEKTTVAVKGAPVINDAVLEDAEKSGITKMVKVIDNGDNAPGTILENSSENLRKLFDSADLVISKGQGNFESLERCGKDNLFFLLKIKCDIVSNNLGCSIGNIAVIKNSKLKTGEL